MPACIGATGSHGRALSKEGAWSDLWFRRVSAAREASEREEIGDRETRQGLSHVCLRGCEEVGTGGGGQISYTSRETGWRQRLGAGQTDGVPVDLFAFSEPQSPTCEVGR